jgi:hypothetical protein
MNSGITTLISSTLLLIGLIVAGYLIGGRYTSVAVQAPNSSYLMVTNRLTGAVQVCVPQGCRDVGELRMQQQQ